MLAIFLKQQKLLLSKNKISSIKIYSISNDKKKQGTLSL